MWDVEFRRLLICGLYVLDFCMFNFESHKIKILNKNEINQILRKVLHELYV